MALSGQRLSSTGNTALLRKQKYTGIAESHSGLFRSCLRSDKMRWSSLFIPHRIWNANNTCIIITQNKKACKLSYTFAVRHSLILLWLEMNATVKVTIQDSLFRHNWSRKGQSCSSCLSPSWAELTLTSIVLLTSWFIWTLFEEVEPSQWTSSVDLKHFTYWILLRTSTKVCMWLWHAQLAVKEGETFFDFIVFGKNGKVISMGFRRTVRHT